MAGRALRQRRRASRRAFDQLWKSGLMNRRQAYRRFQVKLGLAESESCIAGFSEGRCQLVIDMCKRFLGARDRAA